MGQAGGFPVGYKGPYEYRGTLLGPDEIAWIQGLIDAQPSRRQCEIAREVCCRFGWLRPNGEPAKLSCSVFLGALANRGVLLRLPRRQAKPGARRRLEWRAEHWRIVSALGPVPGFVESQPSGPLTVRPIEPEEWWGFRLHMQRYHYLGLVKPAGESICYAAFVGRELVALLMWSAPALHNAPRDGFIGWDRRARERNLPWVVNQSRFLDPAVDPPLLPGISGARSQPAPVEPGLGATVRSPGPAGLRRSSMRRAAVGLATWRATG